MNNSHELVRRSLFFYARILRALGFYEHYFFTNTTFLRARLRWLDDRSLHVIPIKSQQHLDNARKYPKEET